MVIPLWLGSRVMDPKIIRCQLQGPGREGVGPAMQFKRKRSTVTKIYRYRTLRLLIGYCQLWGSVYTYSNQEKTPISRRSLSNSNKAKSA